MFMVGYLGLAVLIGAVIWLMVTRTNHKSRARQSGMAEVNKQQHGNGRPAAKRATGVD